ncbi:MAG: hypothetical protein OXI87_12475 [Albidovulum sp.]|nr:hypothetical protein [Albidovulum sp.]
MTLQKEAPDDAAAEPRDRGRHLLVAGPAQQRDSRAPTRLDDVQHRYCRGGLDEVAEQLARLGLIVAASDPFAEDAFEGAGHLR